MGGKIFNYSYCFSLVLVICFVFVSIANNLIFAATDYVKPTATISAPSTATAGTMVAVTATATDNIGVARVEFAVDNNVKFTDTASPYSFNWDTTGFSGTKTLSVRAYDAADNQGLASRTISIQAATTADTVKPTATISAPSTATAGTMVAVTATATDNIGVARVEFAVDNNVKFTDTASPYSFNWDTTGFSGTKTLSVRAYDAADNQGLASRTISIQAATTVAGTPAVGVLAVPCTGYTYDDWSNCKTDGMQVRTIVTTIPAGCLSTTIGSKVPELSKQCTVCKYTCSEFGECISGFATKKCVASPTNCVPPDDIKQIPIMRQECQAVTSAATTVTGAVVPVNCDYTCSKWGDCAANGKQVCLEFLRNPAIGTCLNGQPDSVFQNCNYSINPTVCTYAYGNWSVDCDALGYRIRPYTASPAGCVQNIAPVTKEFCKNAPCTAYTYDAWSVCSGDGFQTRAIKSKIPEGCNDSSSSAYSTLLKQACSFLPCNSYKYSDWGSCLEPGIQARSILSKMPEGCSNADSAVLKQKCVYILPCDSFEYDNWSSCSKSGIQTRNIVLKKPAKCNDTKNALLKRNCESLICNSYVYSNWSDCNGAGKQKRKVTLSLPAGCSGGLVPVLEQNCDFKKIEVVKEAKVPCAYNYSAWGACVLKQQTRMVLSTIPVNCDMTVAPEVNRACEESLVLLPAIEDNAPGPVPGIMILSEPLETSNFNDRTDSAWQQYYFGATDCREIDVCAGAADPDIDGLSNNDEYRFGTNPISPDTDRDGMVDGAEIKNGRNPLIANFEETSDAVIYENPKESGQEVNDIYQVSDVLYDATKKELKITGKGLPNSYVTIYLFSDPVVLTVKTDSDGNWLYILDKPIEEGSHEVYVVVNDNSGKVIAKSSPLSFIQTAEAATVNYPVRINSEQRAAAPAKARLWEGYLIFFGAGFGGLILALGAIGLMKNIASSKNNKQ